MSALLADIGGTHIRLARYENGELVNLQKYPVAEYQSLTECLSAYSDKKRELYIATAAWPYPDGSWRFARPDRWIISTAQVKEQGWDVKYIGNDFAVGAKGALRASSNQLHVIQDEGTNDIEQKRSAVLGSGTGLGLAYVEDKFVQQTYGGHMDIPQRSDEQNTIIKLAARLKENEQSVCAEDIISGPGLILLYQAVSMIHGKKIEDINPDIILEHKNDKVFNHTLRLYSEFLGMFAHQAIIYGHAYKALYLDGGVLHKLIDSDSFDTERFLHFFIGEPLPLIKKQIMAMPVSVVTDPFITLHGLIEVIKDES